VVGILKYSSTKEMGNSSVLMELLLKTFENTMLLDVTDPKIIFTATNVTTSNRQFLFKNYWKEEDDSDGTFNALVSDAVRATTAAPFFLKEHELDLLIKDNVKKIKLQDGGLVGNNPTMITIFDIDSTWPGVKIDTIISLGTGMRTDDKRKEGIPFKDFISGVVGYVTNQQITHEEVLKIMNMRKNVNKGIETKYNRINIRLEGDEYVSLDVTDEEKIRILKEKAREYIQARRHVIENALT